MVLLNNDRDVSVLVDGLDHVEGVAWGLDGYCYAGGEAGQIYRIDVNRGEATQIADTGGFVLGLALDANHNIYACDTGNRAVMKITPDGSVSRYATGAPDEPFYTAQLLGVRFTNGNLYVCDSGDWKVDNGNDIQNWARRREVLSGRGRLCEFPNGLCVGPDSKPACSWR